MSALVPLFLVLLVIAVPIAFAMGIAAIIVLLVDGSFPLTIVPQRALLAADSFSLLAIPFFVLAGHLMNVGGITDRIIRATNTIVGRFTGGLGLSNVGASMAFGGVSGSALADTTALGSTIIPAMIKEGYGRGFSAVVTAASSTIGPLIPPSIPFVIYGITAGAGVSIGALFLAGFVPGILVGLALMVTVWIISRRRGYPKHPPASPREIFRAVGGASWAILMPVIILGGVVSGIMTVTESAAVAVLYAFFVGCFVYRGFTVREVLPILKRSALDSALVMIVVAMAGLMGWVLAVSGVTREIGNGLLAISENPLVLLLLIAAVLLVVGLFMETVSAMVLLIPVFMPAVLSVGIDPIHFGVVVVYTLLIGMITPPVGLCLFVTQRFAGVSLEAVIRELWPFLATHFLVLLLIIMAPQVVLFIPTLLLG